MTTYHFTLPWVVLDSSDPSNPTLLPNRSDGVLLDRDGNETPARTPLGIPTPIRTTTAGTTTAFVADIPAGRVRFGSVEAAVFADEQHDAADRAEAAATAAADCLASIRHIGENATEVTYFGRDPISGDVWIQDTPILDGSGGKPRLTADGYIEVTFTA